MSRTSGDGTLREIRTETALSERAYSYDDDDDDNYDNDYNEYYEDDFHNKIQKSRSFSHNNSNSGHHHSHSSSHGHGHGNVQRNNSSSSTTTGGGGNTNSSNNNNGMKNSGGSSSTAAAAATATATTTGGGAKSFWRTTNSPNQKKKPGAAAAAATASSFSDGQSAPSFNSVSLVSRKGGGGDSSKPSLTALLSEQHDDNSSNTALVRHSSDDSSSMTENHPKQPPSQQTPSQKKQQQSQQQTGGQQGITPPPTRSGSFNAGSGTASSSSQRDANKKIAKQRKEDRRLKSEHLDNQVDAGHIMEISIGDHQQQQQQHDDAYVHQPAHRYQHHVNFYNSANNDNSNNNNSSNSNNYNSASGSVTRGISNASNTTSNSSNGKEPNNVITMSLTPPPGGFGDLNPRNTTTGGSLLDRSSSDQSTGSLLYGKTPNSTALHVKSGSLIFPTGVEGSSGGNNSNSGINNNHAIPRSNSGGGGGGEGSSSGHITNSTSGGDGSGGGCCVAGAGGGAASGGGGGGAAAGGGASGGASAATDCNNNNNNNNSKNKEAADAQKRRKINLLLDQCETSSRFPFKKSKLILSNLNLTAADIPLNYLCGTPLGNNLHKLSLAANRLGHIPKKLVISLPNLKHLDLSKCELHQIPNRWYLPLLKRLNLSHNRLRDFPEESVLEGLPDLQDLNLYGNKIAEIVVPHDPALLSKLDALNMGYNDLAYLPDDLDQFKSLKTLKVMNNFLEKIPMRICDMDLRSIDVSANPVTQPPIETCERGICSMKRYYHCLRLEEQSKQKALEEVQRRAQRQQRNKSSSGTPMSSSHHASAAKATPAKKKYGAFFNGINPLGQLATMVPQSLTSTVARRALDESANASSSDKSLMTGPATPAAAAAAAAGQLVPSVTGAASVSTGTAAESSSKSLQQSTPPATTRLAVATKITNSSSKEPLSPQQQSTLKMPSKMMSSVTTVPATPLAPKNEVLQSEDTASVMPVEALVKPAFHTESSDGSIVSTTESSPANAALPAPPRAHDEVTVNETLKVIFVGMAMVGKTSMIKRLIKGRDAVIPTHDERTVGVDIYEWDPRKDKRFEHIDSRIEIQDKELMEACGGDKHVMFSVWDFAGQHVYHATHELFFSPRALYVLVWDMGATNRATLRQKGSTSEDTGPFKLTYDSESEDGESDHEDNILEEARRADRALEHDIDEKVQFWVDCIQSSAPGAAILPVASFSDYFANDGGEAEAIRRCNILKQRLMKHEDRRIKGIKERLKEYEDQQRPDDPAAVRLRKLLCSFTRPKLIFGNDHEDSIVRVSGTKYTGFDKLTEKIIGIATGRDKGKWRWPIFHGQVGARIPRMRLEVRDVVREMRIRFKVVEWGYFISQLRERGLTCVEDISDALHFLTNTGELSYFGCVMTDNERVANPVRELLGSPTRVDVPACTYGKDGQERPLHDNDSPSPDEEKDDEDDMDDDEDHAILSMDDTAITAPSTEDGSLTTVEDYMSSGLSQFVFLNPRWLVEAVACILRHDLDREIQETRRMLATGRSHALDRTSSFTDAHLNCPVITAENACMLWQAKRITKKAAERAQEHSNNMAVTPFEFLQLLLIRFGVFVPIDLSIEKAFLGGKDYTKPLGSIDSSLLESSDAGQPTREINVLPSSEESALKAKFFFLPSLLGPGEPTEAWTYKNAEGWKTTLCHSILFPDGVPPGLMERLTASVLSSIYAVANRNQVASTADILATYEGRLTVREVLCWRTAFLLKLGTVIPSSDGTNRESIVEIFALLADRESHLCVGSDYMGVGTRRLIISGRGQVGDGGKKIWKGGYLLVAKCVRRVMDAYGGLEYEKQAFCPECLAKKPVSECSSWDHTTLHSAVLSGEKMLKCRHLGHPVETRLVTGPHSSSQKKEEPVGVGVAGMDPSAPVKVPELMGAVVLVGLWNGKTRKIERAGSGFIVDRKRGLIVTASHVLMDIWGDQNYPFGENYYGNRQGKVVIGFIPQDSDPDASKFKAVFRYFAKIVAKDPGLEKDECHLDACVLRITTRMENDVDGDGEGCADQPEILLLNNPAALKSEKLPALKITDKCELEEQVRILGYNQGGEGLIGPGESLNRYADFARGYVCKLGNRNNVNGGSSIRDRFKPLEEVTVLCHTIPGHSGGPCVNQQGEVIGILSRADPAESQRCYISPTSAWKNLVKKAKNII